jgi:hypothetical protein
MIRASKTFLEACLKVPDKDTEVVVMSVQSVPDNRYTGGTKGLEQKAGFPVACRCNEKGPFPASEIREHSEQTRPINQFMPEFRRYEFSLRYP